MPTKSKISESKRQEIILAMNNGLTDVEACEQYHIKPQHIGAWRRNGYFKVASKAKLINEPRHNAKKSAWTLTLINGSRQFAATVNTKAVKQILASIVGAD